MKLFGLLAVASAVDQKKVPSRHPIERLARLVEFSHELLDDWFTFLPSKDAWKVKFEKNADRMARNFERGNEKCGFFDESQLPHGGPDPEDRKRRAANDDKDDEVRYDRDDPRKGTKQITTGFRKWAERYISACSGQKNHNYQVMRMNKWTIKLLDHLKANPKP